MNKIFIHTAILTLSMLAWNASADIVVVVNKENSVRSMSRIELIDLYMGRYTTFSNKTIAKLIDQGRDTDIRKQFYKQLIGKSVAEVNAFWARLLFTGRTKPPLVIEDSRQVNEAVSRNVNAIAYMDASNIDDSLKVVYRFAAP